MCNDMGRKHTTVDSVLPIQCFIYLPPIMLRILFGGYFLPH